MRAAPRPEFWRKIGIKLAHLRQFSGAVERFAVTVDVRAVESGVFGDHRVEAGTDASARSNTTWEMSALWKPAL